jgi:hypothetical protein
MFWDQLRSDDAFSNLVQTGRVVVFVPRHLSWGFQDGQFVVCSVRLLGLLFASCLLIPSVSVRAVCVLLVCIR